GQSAPAQPSEQSAAVSPDPPGEPIVRLDLIGTGIFTATAVVAAIVFTPVFRVIGVVVALTLFAIGVVTFLWSYWTAVQRSRTENISVTQLYFLAGGTTPTPVKRTMNLLLAGQCVVGLVTAIARSDTDGRYGSTLAFGILVPVFGLGLNGLWCAQFGNFAPRQPRQATRGDTAAEAGISPAVPHSDDQMGQNADHG
ncbi:MAG TPA: hypothetical protein PLV68_16655, partial [Ilumatobacteraceae bacterium]|nr:hypothetical protein [Ilumatobacteraceae bacterium]